MPLCLLTACIPGCLLLGLHTTLQASLHIGFGIASREEDLAEERDVGDGQPERVNFGQALLIWEGGYAAAELVEGRVDAEHPLPLADVGGLPLAAERRGRQGGGARRGRRRGAVRFSTPWRAGHGRGGPRQELVCQGGAVR